MVDWRRGWWRGLAHSASGDHDIVDGAQAARFAMQLRKLVEGAVVLRSSG